MNRRRSPIGTAAFDRLRMVDKAWEVRYNFLVQANQISSVSVGVGPPGENRKPGENPGRDRRCKRVSFLPEAKAGHWGNLRRRRGRERSESVPTREVRRPAWEECTRAPGIGAVWCSQKERGKRPRQFVIDCRGLLFPFPTVDPECIGGIPPGKEDVFMRRGRRRGLSLLLVLVMLLGLLPGTAWAAAPIGNVTFSVETKTIDGNCLVQPMEEELYAGDTVYTILSRVAAEQGLLVEGADTGYVTRIGEFGSYTDSDYGSESGWMVLLNNDYETWPLPELKDGDSVRFCYTYKTYGHDIDLIDLKERLEEKVALASEYTGENEVAVYAALGEAAEKLLEIEECGSNQAYIDSLGTMVYGAGSDAEKLKVLINKLDVTLAGNEYVPTQNVEIQVLDSSSGQAATEFVAGRSYQLRAVFDPDNASWQQGEWKLVTGIGADATVTEDGVLTITGVSGQSHALTVQFWHPEAGNGCFSKYLGDIQGPQTEQDRVNVAQNQLTWDSIKGENAYSYAVTSNFSVPTQLEIEGKTVEVSCASDDSTGALSAYKNGTGTAWDVYVSRPAAQDVSCNLTVTLSCGEAKATKQFPITVKAEGVNEDKTSVVVYGDLMSGIASGYASATEAWTVLEMTAYNGSELSAATGTDIAKALAAVAQGNASVPEAISNRDYITSEPWNIPYVLMVYDAAGANTSEFTNTREELKSSLVTRLNGVGDSTDVEDVTPALAALAAYYGKGDAELDQAVDKGISWLSAHQNSDGTFSTYGTSNANTTALAIVALSALGIDAHTDSRFIKNNKSALEGLFSFALADNTGFGYKGNVTLNTLATEQGFRALVSYARMKANGAPYNIYLEAKNSKDTVPAPNITATVKPGEGSGTGGSGENPQKTVTVTVSVMVPPEGGAEGQYTYNHDSARYTNLLGSSRKVTVASGTTALSVLKSALDGASISYRESSGYVSEINGLAAFDHGPRSGWQYMVDGTAPQEGASTYMFSKNAELVWYYTDDYTKEKDAASWGGGDQTGEAAAVKEQADGSYQVTLPKGSTGSVLVTIPKVSKGDLLVIVHADGTQEVVKKSVIQNGTGYLMLDENATVKAVDYVSDFGDVKESAWYADAVDFTAGRGLFSGVGGGNFAPDETLNRGMVVTVLYALEEAGAQKTEGLFSDVAGDAWYAQGTAWAMKSGIVSGYGDGQFGPDDAITREQLALMLYRYAQYMKLSTGAGASLNAFGDKEAVSSWAQQAMSWAVSAGILGGTPEGNLNPGGTATRAEAAVMVSQFVTWMLKGI